MMTSVLVEPVCRSIRPRKARSWREFAETELVLPNGPMKGMRFRADFRPWVGDVLDIFERRDFWRFFASGPAQDGKTLLFYVIPTLYELFEMERDVILGAPVVDLAWAAYRNRLLPSIMASRFREYLPRTGAGSKGGEASELQYAHGPRLRFVGAGGSDAQRSSHTAPVIGMTELDKMDDIGETSEEADPVTQMQTRAQAFLKSGEARVYGECTMSTEDGIVYREVCEIGTDTRVFLPCKGCGRWLFPERKDFTGWSGAPNVNEARARSRFLCPNCRYEWTEKDREESLKSPRLVSRGQTVDEQGRVQGPMPPTNTFGLRWNAMASPFMAMADIGEAEWRAELTEKEADKKAVVQFKWALPYKAEGLELGVLTREMVEKKMTGHPRGAVPEGTLALTVSIDLGIHRIWWLAIAWGPECRGQVIDYGARDVPRTGDEASQAILGTLRIFRDDTLLQGWSQRTPDLVLVDSGYQPDAAYEFVMESGQGVYAATKGFGTAYGSDSWRPPSKDAPAGQAGEEWKSTPQSNGIYLVNLHADYWKSKVHDGFMAALGSAGSISLYRAERVEHSQFAKQITGEKRIPEDDPKKTVRYRWVRTRANHFLDCASMGRAGADMLGVRTGKGDGK